MAVKLTIALLTFLFIGADSYCNDGWTRYHNSCYFFEDINRRTWDQAYHDCIGKESHLVVVDNADDHNFLKQELHKLHPGAEDQFWTAGNDITVENRWVWGKTNNSILVTYWHPGEPNQLHGEEDCVAYYPRYNMDWNDDHCDKTFYYICEMEDSEEVIIG